MKVRNTYLSALVIFFSFCTNSQAAFHDSRIEKWEFFLVPQYTNELSLESSAGAKAHINERTSLGFGLGYNLNAHIELSVLFSSSNTHYTATLIPEDDPANPVRGSANLYISTIDFGVTYNFLSTPFTPYVSANIGSSYIDSGIPTGEIGSGCWYDYWYGYICTPVAITHTTTELNYGLGAGLRYDFNRKLYIKGGVTRNVIDFNSEHTPDFLSYQFFIGFMF